MAESYLENTQNFMGFGQGNGSGDPTPPVSVSPPPMPTPPPTDTTQSERSIITTSTPARTEYNTNLMSLNNALSMYGLGGTGQPEEEKKIDISTYSDPFTKYLDKMGERSNASTRALISTIQANRANREGEITQTYDNYKRGLQLLGIQHNAAQTTPALLQGQIVQAENEQRSKVMALDAEEAKALMDAENAKTENDFRLLKEKMDYVDKIKKEKANALKDLYDTMTTQRGIAEEQAHDIYDTLQKLGANDKEAFLNAVATKYKIPVGKLVQALNDEKKKRETKAGSGTKQTESEKKQSAWQKLNSIVSQNLPTSSGIPAIDENGFLTPEGFKNMLLFATESGISRSDLIETYANYLYLGEGRWKKYGLTKAEYKDLEGTLPEETIQ